MKHLAEFLFALLIGASPLLAQTEKPSTEAVPQPREVTYCDLSKNPAAFNHELVRLTAFLTYGFEDFQLADPACATEGFSVWVMYGGRAQTGVVYCCPGEGGEKTRSDSLSVEGVDVPLVDDSIFKRLTALLAKEFDTTARVTVVGRFFSGEKQTVNGHTWWGGAGHMGCCSLFVIQRVESFDPHTRNDLDYTEEAGWDETQGCKYGSVEYKRYISVQDATSATQQAIAEQKKADNEAETWRFHDRLRVALESLKAVYPGQTPLLRSVKKTSVRQVFLWKKDGDLVIVVVTRPYWLSFYAASEPVAWVTTTIKQKRCHS